MDTSTTWKGNDHPAAAVVCCFTSRACLLLCAEAHNYTRKMYTLVSIARKTKNKKAPTCSLAKTVLLSLTHVQNTRTRYTHTVMQTKPSAVHTKHMLTQSLTLLLSYMCMFLNANHTHTRICDKSTQLEAVTSVSQQTTPTHVYGAYTYTTRLHVHLVFMCKGMHCTA